MRARYLKVGSLDNGTSDLYSHKKVLRVVGPWRIYFKTRISNWTCNWEVAGSPGSGNLEGIARFTPYVESYCMLIAGYLSEQLNTVVMVGTPKDSTRM